MARTRIRIHPGPVGGWGDSSSWHPNDPEVNYALRDFMVDTLGYPTDHALDQSHRDNRYLRTLNGTNGVSTFTNAVAAQWSSGFMTHLATSLPSEATDITKALALSNPSRAVVSIPNFIHELKDIPGMLKDIVGFKSNLMKPHRGMSAKQASNHWLSLQMGWIPLVSDIQKMLQFRQHVDRRVNELERLYSKGGLKRRIRYGLGSDAKESVGSMTIHSSSGNLITARYSKFTQVERWATVRWIPTALPKVHTPETTRKLATQLVFGVKRLSPVQVWNAVPWTWLADWCTNVGSYLQAHDNTVPCTHGKVNLMTHYMTTQSWVRSDSKTWLSGGDGTQTYESMYRTQGDAALTATLPFLDGRKLSILGALAIQRLRR